MSIPSFTASAPSFAAHFQTPMPRALRDDAASMSHDAFLVRYAPSSGPVRLGHWLCTDVDRPASRLGPQARNYQATMAVGDRIGTTTAAASGPVSALTAMLHERGVSLEIEAFHQLPAVGGTATFIRGTDGVGAEWAMGWSDDVTQSALRAVIACVNRLSA
ncbi:homocitrate synthase [Mycobacterium hodleri]|uniref:Homocitrate synthase n=1 Tax=Mycolicibacterium hodleri TaxID=49897 RepID=A0A544VYR0_9MYCO|nr:homocitrate synthase [Mycolicibacterium hodleri]TQR85114.1 homocitrate synthase [Mycolicibacterium hodleri]